MNPGIDLNSLSAYDYELPQELIAQEPVSPRDSSRLLRLNRKTEEIDHVHFRDLPGFLHEFDCLVLNDTKVIPARLQGRKATGGHVEVFLSRCLGPNVWEALVKLSGHPKPGLEILFEEGKAVLESRLGEGLWAVRLEPVGAFEAWLERIGGIPLPPYIHRESLKDRHNEDQSRYQTVFAKHDGAVAAPTAGLHFTDELFRLLHVKGVRVARVTLHVGLGTFQPIREENLDLVRLHKERYAISSQAISTIYETKAQGGRIVAVGTTSVRVLETLAQNDRWEGHEGETELFLRPGCQFSVVDAILTNFHLPKSSLLMLIAAFAGKSLIDRAYREAIQNQYRFFSYGDAMLIE